MARIPLRPVVAAIRAAAQRRGWTAYRLAKETGLTEQTMQRLLDGKGSPTLYTVETAAKAVGLKVITAPT